MLLLTIATCLSLFFHGVSGWALPIPWVATSYYEQYISTIITATTFSYISVTESAFIETNVVNVIPTQTPVVTLTVVTTIDKFYSDLTLVNVLIPTGAGTTIDPVQAFATTYYVELFYTAPESCASRWVFSTTARVNAPVGVTFAATSVSTFYTQNAAFGPTTTGYNALVNPTDIPAEHLSSISSQNAPYFNARCSMPASATATTTSLKPGSAATGAATTVNPTNPANSASPDTGPSEGEWFGCVPFVWYFGSIEAGRGYVCNDGEHYTSGITILNFALAWIFGWLGFFLIIGLIESYVSFSRLARGLKARRGLPIAFACLLPLLSCLLLFFSRSGPAAKPPAEQAYLAAQWRNMPITKRLRLWLQWGFRCKYPPFLSAPPLQDSEKWGGYDPPGAAVAPEVVPPHLQMQMHTHQQPVYAPAEMEQPSPFHELPSPDGGTYVVHEKPT